MGGRQEDRVPLLGGPWLVLLIPQAGRELDSFHGDEQETTIRMAVCVGDLSHEDGIDGSLCLDHVKPSWFHRMSREHIVLNLNLS